MVCPAILTGDGFLARVLDHIDCQAQSLGSFGFQALAAPGSPAAVALTGLLTLFVALFAIRLLFGPAPSPTDVIGDLIKVAIVLTLALSWPAYRTLVYNLVLRAPAEIAATIASPELPPPNAGLSARLQNIDTGIVALTVAGTGRNTGALLDPDDRLSGFRAIALTDEATLGWGRVAFLAGTIAPLAIIRIAAGILLALAPLAASLLLFEASRGLFAGWLRGLVTTMLGAIGITITLAAELAVLEPWLADALRLRELGYATPSAPTELVAITTAFGIAALGTLLLLARVAFYRGWPSALLPQRLVPGAERLDEARLQPRILDGMADTAPSRAYMIAESVRTTLRREELASQRVGGAWADRLGAHGANVSRAEGRTASDAALGSSGRRTSRRASPARQRRDASS